MKIKKKREFPNAFVILIGMLAFLTTLNWIIPAGEYSREIIGGKIIVNPNSFKYVDQNPVGFMHMIEAIPVGIHSGKHLITMIFTIGATIGIIDSTGAIRAGIFSFHQEVARL